MESLFKTACEAIDTEAESLMQLSHTIWSQPELYYEEKIAHETLTNYLESRGFAVARQAVQNLDTAFRATWIGKEANKESSGLDDVPNIGFLCEYDALPEIGHACGHNLIAQVGVAAGLGVKAAMEKHGRPVGKVTVLGTPAEEFGGGKIDLINAGAFQDMDVAMMSHPAFANKTSPAMLAAKHVTAVYQGRASHASAMPWGGINALDATVQAYNSISAMRQQLKPTHRLSGIITKGGTKPNIIPEVGELRFLIRAETCVEIEMLAKRIDDCFRGAAMATGCTVDVKWEANAYANMISNKELAQLYDKHIQVLEPGRQEVDTEKESLFLASSDMGNVSHVVPSLHPIYFIGQAVNHTREFTSVAGSKEAQRPTLNQAKALAMTGIELMCNPTLLEKVRTEFALNVRRT